MSDVVKYYVNGQEVGPPKPPSQLDRIEQLLTEIRDALKPPAPEHIPGMGLTMEGFDGPTMGTPYTEKAPPLQADPTYGFDVNAMMGGAMEAMPLPPARPADAEPDLDTALTMGMEAPAPIVVPTRAGPPSLYPRADLTPGVIFPQITADDVSVPGYAKRVRAVPDAMKRAVFLRYGLDPAKHAATEVDHFVSLCLAGTNDIENLWPQLAVTPDAPGQVGFHEKDQLEMFLYHEVCQKTITLQEAQDTIRGDWFAAWQAIPRDHPAMMLSYADAPEQP